MCGIGERRGERAWDLDPASTVSRAWSWSGSIGRGSKVATRDSREMRGAIGWDVRGGKARQGWQGTPK